MLNDYNDLLVFLNSRPMQELNTLRCDIPEKLASLALKSNEMYNNNTAKGPYFLIENRNKKNNKAYFYNFLHQSVFGAAKGTLYNLNTFLNYCSFVEQKASEAGKCSNLPGAVAIVGEKIIFEYEHFTLHSRILLDRLNEFFNYFFITDARNIYKLYNRICNNNGIGKSIADVVDSHRDYLDQLISSDKSKQRTERDELAHRKEIQFTVINLHFYPSNEVKVFLPTKDNFEVQADETLITRYSKLMEFTYDILNSFFDYDFSGE